MDSGRFGPIRPEEAPQKRKRKIDYNRLTTAIMVLLIIVLVIAILWYAKSPKDDEGTTIINQPPAFMGVAGTAASAAPTVKPVADLRPQPAAEGFLPVFYQANTEELVVAITIDECGSETQMKSILASAAEYNANLTFFPTGTEIAANEELWAAAFLGGHEIENHTMTGAHLAGLDAESLIGEIDGQTDLVREVIGAEYASHFLRTDDLEDDTAAALHALLSERGYMGIARWAQKTPANFSSVAPGQILSYTASDAKTLKTVMRILSENGYRMVTLNELFAYPENIESTAEIE